MTIRNVFLCGVGGQGIGLLSAVLARACIEAGLEIRGSDTHGLAQRGGTVISHLRIGAGARMPRVTTGQADIVVALERLEAFRAAHLMLRSGGDLIYYDTVYQPMHVRSRLADYPSSDDVAAAVDAKGGRTERVVIEDLADPRMQNVALLGRLAALGAIAGVERGHFVSALAGVVPAAALDKNLEVFEKAAGGDGPFGED